jgi:hypothetical protein
MNKIHEKNKSPNKNIFILNSLRMIFTNKRTEIKIEEYSETKLMESIHHFLKTFLIEQDVDFEFDNLPPLQDISIDIACRFVLHIRNKVKGCKIQDNEVSFTDNEGKTFKMCIRTRIKVNKIFGGKVIFNCKLNSKDGKE